MATMHCRLIFSCHFFLKFFFFQRSLSCTHDTIKSKIFSGDHDCIGVVLFGTRPVKTDQSDFESVQVLLPLAPPSGAAILALERLLGDHGSATLDAEVFIKHGSISALVLNINNRSAMDRRKGLGFMRHFGSASPCLQELLAR